MPASTKTLRTWSRGTSWRPQQVLRPTSQEAVVAAIQAARARGCSLRVLGGGHSFSALAATDGITLSLDGLQGLLSADPETGLVTLRGGTRLWAIAELLAPYGLALSVMGDIDRQSIAGAIQTGTHGTGAAFTGFAGMVRGLRLVLADGSVVDTSPSHDPDLFEAARLGLGSIAVVLEVTVQCVPAYRLELVERTEALEPTAASFLADSSRADHHEFFWFPRADRATVRTMRRLPPHAPRHRPARAVEVLQQDVLGNGAWELLCRGAALVPPLSRPLAEIASHLFAGPRVIDDSAAVFVAPRRVRFHESEWALPADRFEEAFAALRARLEAEDVRVTFPLGSSAPRPTGCGCPPPTTATPCTSLRIATTRRRRDPTCCWCSGPWRPSAPARTGGSCTGWAPGSSRSSTPASRTSEPSVRPRTRTAC